MTLTVPNVVVYLFPLLLWLLLWGLFYFPLAHAVLVLKSGIRIGAGWLANTSLVKQLTGHSAWKGIRSYAPMLLILAAGGVAAASAGYLFIELARHFRLPTSSVYRMDQAVRQWFVEARQPGTTTVLKTVTFFGGFYGLLAITAVVGGLLFYARQRATAVYLVVTAIGGMLLNVFLKSLFARSRPDMDISLAVATWYSFPSGHAMGSFVLYASLAYVALRQTWPWKADSAALAAALTMIVLIGLSRVYLGVHWTSDIGGGWSAAAVWVAATTVAYEMLLRQRQRRRGAKVPASPTVDIPDKPVPAET